MSDSEVGIYRERYCCLCCGLVSFADSLYPHGVQVMPFHQVAHRSCFDARYTQPAWDKEPTVEEKQAGLFDEDDKGIV